MAATTSESSADARGTSRRRDLAPAGALGRLDRAFSLVRAGGLGLAARAWAAGTPLALLCIALYYVERVEGVHVLRGPFALAIVVAWWLRAHALGRVAREHARRLWDGAPIPDGAGRPIDALRTSMWTALGLVAWSWVIGLAALGGVLGIVLVSPIFAIRGAFAPSWIARAACSDEAGFRAIRGALGDSAGQRAEGFVSELLMVLGTIALFVDLLIAVAIVLLLGRSFLGLELALLDAFLSWRNTFVLLAIGLVAVVLLEPIRAALSATTWVEARVRAEGLDLRVAVEDAIVRAPGARGARSAGIAAMIAIGLFATTARAQEPPPAFPPPPPPAEFTPPPPAEFTRPPAEFAPPEDTAAPPVIVAPDPHDDEVTASAAEILDRPEFEEFDDTRGRGLRELFERLVDWLLRHRDPIEIAPPPQMPAFALPGPIVFMLLAALVLAAFIAILVITRPRFRRGRAPVAAGAVLAASSEDPRDRAPAEWVDDAAALAARGLFREALRSLYLATLVALDRRRLIRFDRTLTNGQYLRQMPEVDARRDFRDFTRLFDHKWYGHEETTEHDYRTCRSLAERIVDTRGGAP